MIDQNKSLSDGALPRPCSTNAIFHIIFLANFYKCHFPQEHLLQCAPSTKNYKWIHDSYNITGLSPKNKAFFKVKVRVLDFSEAFLYFEVYDELCLGSSHTTRTDIMMSIRLLNMLFHIS